MRQAGSARLLIRSAAASAAIWSCAGAFGAEAVSGKTYRFYESGGTRAMTLSATEVVVKGKTGAADAGVLAALRRHSPRATILEKWDRRYLAGVPASAGFRSLTGKAAPLRAEAAISESAPVLYVVEDTPRLKSGEVLQVEQRRWKMAAMRIVTRSVLAELPSASEGARVREATNATAGAPAGTGDWWLFDYATPLEALDAAVWMAESANLVCTPVFERMRFSKAGPAALTPNDPLFPNQWHLTHPIHGINVTGVWDTFQGTGRNLLVIDDGIQVSHPDLAPNAYPISSGNHFDFNNGDSDPSPVNPSDSHGTACTGLAIARANNGIGVAGVAFAANLMGIRLNGGPASDRDERDAFAWKPALTDVVSNSWGALDDIVIDGPGPLGIAGLQTATSTGRGGRGAFFVFAAGNGRNQPTVSGGLTDDDANYDGYANSRFVTAVGAVSDRGQQAYYSENGANVALVAPSSGGNSGAGLTTVDRTGTAGYETGDYTGGFGGTSGSTPIVAGAATLLVQSNPNLGWRDIKEILMRSASRPGLTGGDPFAINGAGFAFSHSFGAGRLNVGTAVAMAAGWTNVGLETSIVSSQTGIGAAIPDNNVNGVVRSFDFSGQQDLRVETVELTVNVTHSFRGDLRFIVTAPSGMQSLVDHRPADRAANLNWTFTSVRHWGEHSTGVWSVRVADVDAVDTGTLNSLTLRIWGAVYPSNSSGTGTFVSSDVPKAVPDANAGGVTSVINVTNSGTITDLNLTLNAAHQTVPDLEITLTPPGGFPIPLVLASPQGGILAGLGALANFSNTTFDDQAATNLRQGAAPFGGSFNINHVTVGNNVLAQFNGRSAAGQWILKIADRSFGGVGTLMGWSLTITTGAGGTTTSGLRFVPVTPCRLADTREPSLGAFGTPALTAGSSRTFTLPNAGCGIPANAAAYSLNATVVPKEPLGFITIWPTGTAQPFVSTLNAVDGRIKANAAIVPAGNSGAINVFANNATELILDINGYFIDPAANGQSLAFYPLTPCRVVDTRNANGALGGPVIAAGASRNFPVLSSNCGVSAGALAYSLNATVIPSGPLGFLTLWPTGQPQPFVSTLNALTGAIVANAAIVPVGTNGSVSAFVSGQSHLVLDINGYFAAPGAANAQRFFTATPCRVLDTRNAAGEFGGPVLAASQPRSYRLPLATCNLPQTAAAYSLNATVVPAVSLGFLTLWPTGTAQPFVSTLNAPDDPIVANAAIVPAGTGGGVSSYVTNQTHLILDTNGYFAP